AEIGSNGGSLRSSRLMWPATADRWGGTRRGARAPRAASAPIDRREGRGAQGARRQDHRRRDAKPNGLKEHPTNKVDPPGYAPRQAFEFRFGPVFPMVSSPEPS